MKVSEILEEASIVPALKARNKKDAIQELVDTLADTGAIRDRVLLMEGILAREQLGSTGIGENIAIPHAKSKETDKVIALYGRSLKGLDFDSLDRKPVHHIFMLVAPEDSGGSHLKALARISRLLKSSQLRNDLLRAGNRKELYRIIINEDLKFG